MKTLRRLLYVPVVAVLIGALLIVFKIYTYESLESQAVIVAIVAAGLFLAMLAWEVHDITRSWELPEPEEPPKSVTIIYPKPLDKAEEALEKAEQFANHANGRVRIRIDIDESKND